MDIFRHFFCYYRVRFVDYLYATFITKTFTGVSEKLL